MASLKDLRTGRDLTLAQLSKIAGVRLETLSRLESGKQKPHQSTLVKIANALRVNVEQLEESIPLKTSEDSYKGWRFLKGLDNDLRKALLENLISSWTHNSTSLEGNTISEGDTYLILTEGLTVSGKSLREHQEVYGHGSAIKKVSSWIQEGKDITINRIHQLHQLIQTEMIFDTYAPIGKFKVEKNGTMAIRRDAQPQWHYYSDPIYIPFLMSKWMDEFKAFNKLVLDTDSAVEAYTRCHVGFVSIHPYADGNGRMARLLSNAPLLASGYPPIVVRKEDRREYLTLLGDYCTKYPSPTKHGAELNEGKELKNLKDFFEAQWEPTQRLIAEFVERQTERVNRAPLN